MRTLSVGVVPTTTECVGSLSGARVTSAPAGSLRKICVCEMRGQSVASDGVAGCTPLRLARELERRVELVGVDQSLDGRESPWLRTHAVRRSRR